MFPALRTLLVALTLPTVPSPHAATASLPQPAAPPQCPFTADYLKTQLGVSFAAGVPESGIIGKACTYKAGSIKLWVDAGKLQAPSADAWRKMASAPGTKWQPVAGDPDKAVHEIAPPGVGVFPALSYERAGWMVSITVTGVDGKANVDAWNGKLEKLKRIP